MEAEFEGYRLCLCSSRYFTEYSMKSSSRTFHDRVMCSILRGERAQEGMYFRLIFRFPLTIPPARLIMIMLFRLQMSVDEAIHAYTTLTENIFSSKNWTLSGYEDIDKIP